MQTKQFNLNVFLILLGFCSALILSACEEDDEGSSGGEDITCQAAPACGSDQVEVDSCEEGDESCQAVTMCEQTIYCREGEHRDHEDEDHDHEDDDQEDDVTCQAAPACGPDQMEVEACEEGDEACEEVTLCEQTIYCTSAE